MATKANKSAPAPKLSVVSQTGAASNTSAAPEANTPEPKPAPIAASKGKRVSFWDKEETKITDQARDKMALMGDVRQGLEHARQLFNEGSGKATEAQEIAAKEATRLYQGRKNGLVNNDEISSTLGDIFGYKVKGGAQAGATPTTAGVPKDFTVEGKVVASKTPFGPGEAIRKRIVRAVQAFDYSQGGDGGSFFTGLPTDEIEDVLDLVSANEMSLWTAYDRFAEIKRDHTDRVAMAFDPKKIGTIVEALAEEGAAEKLHSNPGLVAHYKGLVEVLNILGERLAEMDEAA